MGKHGQRLNYPKIEDIANLNRKMIHRTGGNIDGAGCLRNPGSLEWVLEAIQYPLFGVDMFPTISDKAAALCWVIITRHVFIDGVKRTAFSTLELFLEDNGFYLSVKDEEIKEITVKITKSTLNGYTQEEFADWVRSRLKLLYPYF